MDFKYDFDMFSLIPDEVRQQFQGMLNEVGMGAASTEQKAMFRDPALVEALQGADDAVKSVFLDAGFGLNAYHSGAPEGRYPGHDEDARNICVHRLAENIAAAEGLSDADWNGFDIGQFLTHLATTRPIDEIEMREMTAPQHPVKKKKPLLRLGLVAGGAMIMVSTVGIVLGTIGS